MFFQSLPDGLYSSREKEPLLIIQSTKRVSVNLPKSFVIVKLNPEIRDIEYSPLPGYIVDFSAMIQTKVVTGFQREVQRFVQQESFPPDIDLKDVQFGDELPVDLEGEPQMVLVTGDVIQIAKQRADGWAFGTALHHADGAASRHLVSVDQADFGDGSQGGARGNGCHHPLGNHADCQP